METPSQLSKSHHRHSAWQVALRLTLTLAGLLTSFANRTWWKCCYDFWAQVLKGMRHPLFPWDRHARQSPLPWRKSDYPEAAVLERPHGKISWVSQRDAWWASRCLCHPCSGTKPVNEEGFKMCQLQPSSDCNHMRKPKPKPPSWA